MAEHVLRINRYQRGQQTYGNIRGAAGMQYGTEGRCSCGEWSDRRNIAPSKGGRKAIEETHALHVAKQPQECPDGGRCHHLCGNTTSCFRVVFCGPLSIAGWEDWPDEIKAANPPENVRPSIEAMIVSG